MWEAQVGVGMWPEPLHHYSSWDMAKLQKCGAFYLQQIREDNTLKDHSSIPEMPLLLHPSSWTDSLSSVFIFPNSQPVLLTLLPLSPGNYKHRPCNLPHSVLHADSPSHTPALPSQAKPNPNLLPPCWKRKLRVLQICTGETARVIQMAIP